MNWNDIDPRVKATCLCIVADMACKIADQSDEMPCGNLKANMYRVGEGLAAMFAALHEVQLDGVSPLCMEDDPPAKTESASHVLN